MKITCCGAQIQSIWGDPAATLTKANRLVARAAASGAALVAFPEQFATGWDPGSTSHTEDLSGITVSILRRFARENSIALIGSFRERNSPCPLNTAVAIGSSGEVLAKYSKSHLFSPAGEDQCFSPGNTLSVFEIAGIKVGIAICYDLRFSSVFEGYVDLGADAVIVPAAWPAKRGRHWELFLQSRAAEFQLYIIGVNTTGITPVDTYSGGSLIVDPAGTIISRIGAEEGLVCGPLDPEVVKEVRTAMPVAGDRREGSRRLFSAREK